MKRYRIAGLNVDMDVADRTAVQAEAYEAAVDGPADITIRCDVQQFLQRNPSIQTLEMAQYVVTGIAFTRGLLEHNGTYLHASAVVLDGKAYLFSADSGTGKSTHTEKWCRLFGATYLNDDKPALRLVDGVWMAYGTPWSGKHDLSAPIGVPLGGIAFLKRGQENTIRRLAASEAIPEVLKQSLWKLGSEQMSIHLELVDKLLRQIPVWELICKNEDAAALVSRDAMVQAAAQI